MQVETISFSRAYVRNGGTTETFTINAQIQEGESVANAFNELSHMLEVAARKPKPADHPNNEQGH